MLVLSVTLRFCFRSLNIPVKTVLPFWALNCCRLQCCLRVRSFTDAVIGEMRLQRFKRSKYSCRAAHVVLSARSHLPGAAPKRGTLPCGWNRASRGGNRGSQRELTLITEWIGRWQCLFNHLKLSPVEQQGLCLKKEVQAQFWQVHFIGCSRIDLIVLVKQAGLSICREANHAHFQIDEAKVIGKIWQKLRFLESP